jgi:hypothetical protein
MRADAIRVAMVDRIRVGGSQSIENLLRFILRSAGGDKRPKD